MLKYVSIFLVTLYMILNVNGSFDVKNQTLAKPFIEFLFFKIIFFIFLQTRLKRIEPKTARKCSQDF